MQTYTPTFYRIITMNLKDKYTHVRIQNSAFLYTIDNMHNMLVLAEVKIEDSHYFICNVSKTNIAVIL